MARTTATDVKDVIDTNLSDSVVESFITTANIYVTDKLGGEGLSADLLEQIEKWFTAHLIAMSRQKEVTREEVDNAQVEYAGKFGQNLQATRYGQVVITLDTTGIMVGSKGEAGFWAIETDYDE
jgi:hypothetical protein